jgi:hypothetical protein
MVPILSRSGFQDAHDTAPPQEGRCSHEMTPPSLERDLAFWQKAAI